MKKVLLVILAIAIASPAMAAVTLTSSVSGLTATVGYSWDGTGARPRAFALTVAVTGGNVSAVTATKTGVSAAGSLGFGIFPGTIQINTDGTVANYNTPVEPATLPGATGTGIGTSSVVLALGSLYNVANTGDVPANSGNLFSFTISAGTSATVTPETAYRGGVIGEDAAAITVAPITISFAAPECMKATAAAYNDWVQFGKPTCWCYARQCRGDINGTGAGTSPSKKWVTSTDLTAFKLAYNIANSALPAGGICADLNHTGTPSTYSLTQKRVTSTDLTTFKLYYNKAENDATNPVTVCPSADYNFWTN